MFLPLTLAVAVAAGAWLLSGDRVRALAGHDRDRRGQDQRAGRGDDQDGISREARRGLIVKGGGAL